MAYIYGTYFPDEIARRVRAHEMDFLEILELKELQQRSIAMFYANVDNFLRYTRTVPGHQKLYYILYEAYAVREVPFDTNETVFLRPRSQPVDKDYISSIPPNIRKIQKAMKWKISTYSDTCTEETSDNSTQGT